MYFDALPNEIITNVYLSLPTIASALALSSTCHRFRNVYRSSQRLQILSNAAELEFGPVSDIIQIVTHNASQPAHVRRIVPTSDALLRQIVKVGRVAQRWEEIYPLKKWKHNYAHRRLLNSEERYRLRCAIYRLWLFTRAFHNREHVRTCRALPQVVSERAALLHNFNASELADMLDVHLVMRDLVANNICPSNGKIREKFRKRYPDSNQQLLFNIHLNYPPAPSTFVPSSNDYLNSCYMQSKYHSRLTPSRFHEVGAEGWGDEILHYYVVEDMMKLDPGQILWLRDNCPLKHHVESYVSGLGEWFGNNGETFSETLAVVLRQRGLDDLEVLKLDVEDEEMGVTMASC